MIKKIRKIKPVLRIVIMIALFALVSLAYAQNARTYIPERAFEYRDDLYNEITRIIPELPEYNFVGALIEHESCISLTHSKCWSATAELNNSREYSIGFFQIAKAYRPDGSIRMDTLGSLKGKYRTVLAEANWSNLKNRPDLQMRVGMTLILDNWNYFNMIEDPVERMYFVDNAYNGGAGNVAKERSACGLAAGCDPQKWFGNVERYCQRSKKPIPAYGNRSICDISRNHTVDVFQVRLPKYQKQYFNQEYLERRRKQ